MTYFDAPYRPADLTLNSDAINSSLVGFWPLTDGSGTSAVDISTGGNNGTQSGGVSWASSEIGTVASFDGSDDQFDISHNSSYNAGTTGELTVTAWAKFDTFGTYRNVVSKDFGFNHGAREWVIYGEPSGNRVSAQLFDSSGTAYGVGTGVNTTYTGVWYFLSMVWDGTDLKLFVDGSVASTASAAITPRTSTEDVQIGYNGRFRHDGDVQNVRIFSSALTAAQVEQLYTRPWTGTNYDTEALWLSPPASPTLSTASQATALMSGCQAWYPLTEGTGTTATCIMGHSAHNGTLDTGVTWEASERGTAAKFDGTNNAKITLGSEPVSGQTISVSAWVYSEETSGVQAIYCSRQSGFPDSKNYLFYNANTPRFSWDQYQPSGGGTDSGTISDARGRWVHVVATQDATTSKIYVDGELKGSAASETYSSTAGAYYIGYRYSAQVMTGSIQNLRVWDRVLSADEALLLYERPWEGIEYGDTFHHDPPAPASMLPLTSDAINTDQEAWWPLTQTTGSTCTDISGNSLDGTQNGTEVWQNSELGYVHESSGTSQNYFDNCGSTSDFAFAHTTGIMTISCWIRPTATGRSFILANNDTSGANGFFFDRKNGNGMDFYMGTSGVGGTTSVSTANDTAPSDGSWQHWVFVLDTGNSVAQFYKNGVAVTTTGTIAGTGTGSTKYTTALGGLSSVPSETFDGDLQNVRVWSRALTADEIWSIYATNPWLGSNYKLASGSTLYNYIFRTERFRRLG